MSNRYLRRPTAGSEFSVCDPRVYTVGTLKSRSSSSTLAVRALRLASRSVGVGSGFFSGSGSSGATLMSSISIHQEYPAVLPHSLTCVGCCSFGRLIILALLSLCHTPFSPSLHSTGCLHAVSSGRAHPVAAPQMAPTWPLLSQFTQLLHRSCFICQTNARILGCHPHHVDQLHRSLIDPVPMSA